MKRYLSVTMLLALNAPTLHVSVRVALKALTFSECTHFPSSIISKGTTFTILSALKAGAEKLVAWQNEFGKVSSMAAWQNEFGKVSSLAAWQDEIRKLAAWQYGRMKYHLTSVVVQKTKT